jgi:signal transduction histidine kinase
MSLEAGDALGELPAAVEVAAYRIVAEALTNVVRHSGARTCTVRLDRDDAGGVPALYVEIVDDGIGLATTRHDGVGLVSMRERARELGGDCTVLTDRDGGCRVRARLPMPVPSAADSASPERPAP